MSDTERFYYGIASDLVAAGCDEEDGEPITEEAHYIVIERFCDGRRWAHDFAMRTRPGRETPGRLLQLLAEVEAKAIDPVGREHWREIRPNYCSEAARRLEREEAALERRDEL
jgi:hypothetical protein